MKGVAHEDDALPLVRLKKCRNLLHGLTRRTTVGLDHDRGVGNTVLLRIPTTDGCFARRVAITNASGKHERRREAVPPELDGVIESGAKHGRRPTYILRCAEHHDGSCRLRIVAVLPDENAGE